jgi:hypothetical protein
VDACVSLSCVSLPSVVLCPPDDWLTTNHNPPHPTTNTIPAVDLAAWEKKQAKKKAAEEEEEEVGEGVGGLIVVGGAVTD